MKTEPVTAEVVPIKPKARPDLWMWIYPSSLNRHWLANLGYPNEDTARDARPGNDRAVLVFIPGDAKDGAS